MSKKRPRRACAMSGGLAAIVASQPHTEEHVRRLMETTRVALVRLLEGTAEDIHIGRLGIDVNMGWVLNRAESAALKFGRSMQK